MASSKQLINSLLTEHFRYTPLTLVDEIINVVNEVIYKAVTGIEDGLSSASPALLGFAAARAAAEGRPPSSDADGTQPQSQSQYPEALVEIEEGVHKLETLLGATVDRNFDKTEIYILRNILSVPEELLPWMRLGHYEGLDFSQKQGDNEPTLDSLFALRRKTHETQRLHQALSHESSRNSAMISQLHAILYGPNTSRRSNTQPAVDLSFLANDPSAKAMGVSLGQPAIKSEGNGEQPRAPLETHAQQAFASLPALKSVLEQLKPMLADAPPLPVTSGAQEERREYVETQVRRQLERHGISVESGEALLGPATAGGDGSGSLRTGVGRPEVASIEDVVTSLGKQSRRTNQDAMQE